MIKANLNPKYEILERDKIFWHIRFQKTAIDPAFPTKPIIRYLIQPIRDLDYQRFFKCSAEKAVEYLKAMNMTGAEVIHDPTLLKISERTIKPEEMTAEHKYREGKRLATLNDIKAAQK